MKDKLKVEMYDDVVKEKNKEYIELICRFRQTCNDIKNKDKEIERLNNIINELEKYIEHYLFCDRGLDVYETGIEDACNDILKKLKKLKDGDKE